MAIYARAVDGDDVGRISNSGTLWGETDGIHLTGLGKIVIANSGLIEGFRHGISNDFFGTTDTALLLTNSGVVRGLVSAVQTGGGNDRVFNLGRLEGEVRLGGGLDFFDNRAGIALDLIFLEDGEDRFIGNSAWAETVDGGAGKDTLDFRQQGAAIVALDESFGNAGAALGDTYTGFEVIWGSLSGNDKLRGDAGANSLLGMGGNDTLDGAAGQDTLRGGLGVDTLTGGAGNDTFLYGAINEFGDKILDFSSTGAGNDDRFQFVASALGGGLTAGTLGAGKFQSRADNLAQDADDRFIFRTTDKTLWFDVDGTGAEKAIMVADLQGTATMTNADIVLI